MSVISRTQFQIALLPGTPEQLLAQAKAKTEGLPDQASILERLNGILAQVDVNTSGLIGDNVNEVAKLWKLIDDYDKNGNANSVTKGKGTAYELAWALMVDPGLTRIAQVTRNIVNSPEAEKWGQEVGDLAPVYNATYNGGGFAANGDVKAPPFLNGAWKCSVFASEMMFRAGYVPPYSSHKAGTPQFPKRHYEMACEFHKHTKYYNGQTPVFASVQSLDALLPGDIITFQRWGGDKWNVVSDGGHAMVVVGTTENDIEVAQASYANANIVSLASRLRGEPHFSYSSDLKVLLDETERKTDTYGTFFEKAGSVRVRFLRPIQKYA